VPNLPNTNEVIGVNVTAGARNLLYKYLDSLQQRAFYCDTDSVIFIQLNDQPYLIKTGECLGTMTSELKPGIHIDKFVSGGHKNYEYRIVNPSIGERETACKVREAMLTALPN
jgi:hypothetical protein